MRLNYKKLGDYIRRVDQKNKDGKISLLLGVSMHKRFIKSVANTVGVDISRYNVIKKGQFACKLMSVGRDNQLPIDLLKAHDEAIVSSAYYVFESKDEDVLDSEYLMMWFSRKRTDKWCGFMSGGDVRGSISWDIFCEMELPVPDIEKQREIVKEYNTVVGRIKLNEKMCEKLEETAQVVYREWFVDFEFPNENGNPYKSGGGEMVWCEELEKDVPKGWKVEEVKNFCLDMKSGGTPNRGISEYWNSKDIPWLKTGEICNTVLVESEEYISNEGLKNSSAKVFPINTVLIAMYGEGHTKGQVGLLRFEAATNQACCAMICGSTQKSSYLYYHLRVNRDEVVSIAIGGAQPNLSKEIIENILIATPPNDVLKKHPLMKFLNQREALIKECIQLRKLKNLLLSKMAK